MVYWLAWGPVATAAVWLAVVGLQVARYPHRTLPEKFLLCTCACFVVYAGGDALVFWAPSASEAWLAEILGVSALTLSTAFFVLFGASLYGRPVRDLFLAFAPSAAMVASGPILLAAPPIAGGLGDLAYLPRYHPLGFAFWAAYVSAYGVTGLVPLYRAYREIRLQAQLSTRRALAFVLASATGIALWIAWSATVVIPLVGAPPFFSTALVLPGIIALVASLPPTHGVVIDRLRRARARQYGVQAAFLVHKGGLLIDSRDIWGEVGVDADLFGATLDVIQSFMRTSFPFLGDPGLRSVAFGRRTLLIERGRYAYLIVVIAGQEDEILRWTLRDFLREFESRNAEVLRDWSGRPEDAEGTGDLLSALVTPEQTTRTIPFAGDNDAGPVK
ncbi:MAG TPA: hypothetical protein VIB49_05395 [Thermoplasmata archaeon]|jgi:hypothetical protein